MKQTAVKNSSRLYQRLKKRFSCTKGVLSLYISILLFSTMVIINYPNWKLMQSMTPKLYENSREGLSAGKSQKFNLYRRPKFQGPSVLMVTAFPIKCMSALSTAMLAKVMKNHNDYARIHQFDVWQSFDQLNEDVPEEWNKIIILQKLMEFYEDQYDWLWWLDHEAMISNLNFQIPFEKYAHQVSLVLGPADEWALHHEPSHDSINLGTFLLKNNVWSMKFLDNLLATRLEANREDTETYSWIREVVQNMPAVTDQAVIVYKLHQSRSVEAEWKRIFFAAGFGGLDGSWREACGKLMDGNIEAKNGTEKDPFVIHFGGCSFCGGSVKLHTENCQEQFNRTYNHADNQVLAGLKLRHVDSSTSSTLQDLPQAGND